MDNLKTIAALVKTILEQDEQARNNDYHLYMRVLEIESEKWNKSLYSMSVCYFLEHRKELGAPNFETVRRARQKIQATYPELAACDKVMEGRLVNEAEYREFAKEVIYEEV